MTIRLQPVSAKDIPARSGAGFAIPSGRRGPLARALDWLVARDAAWRQARALERMPEHRLTDMGLKRRGRVMPR